LASWPNKIMWLASATSVFSMVKWVLAGITMLVILVGAIKFLISHNKPSR
jgi:hypothetical protein